MAGPVQTSIHETHLICESPSGNVAILLNLGLIDRLRNLIGATPDQEIRAILLGRTDTPGRNSGRRVVIIDDFEPISALENALPTPERMDSNVPVGLFRSRERKGLYLEDADFSLFREYFSGRPGIYPDVFLAARHDAAGIPTARFFFSPDGVLQREVSSTPFSLDRATLEAGGHSLLGGSMHPAPPATGKLAFVPTTRNTRRLVYGSLGGALIFGALIWAAIMNMPAREEASSIISLSVERKANTLRLTWDPNAPAVAHANSGILWISDGDKRRGLELNSSQLKSGAYLYTPEDSIVNFRLDLLKVLAQGSESVRYVAGTTASPNAPPEKPDPMKTTVEEQATVRPPQPPPQLHPEPVVSITTQPLPTSKVREWIARVPIVRSFQKNRNRGEGFVPPRTVREVMPRVSARLAKELPGESRVDVKVSLDANGIVREIDLLSPGGDERLARIASDTLRQWRFEPARMHNKPVPCDLLATLNIRNPPPGELVAQKE